MTSCVPFTFDVLDPWQFGEFATSSVQLVFRGYPFATAALLSSGHSWTQTTIRMAKTFLDLIVGQSTIHP